MTYEDVLRLKPTAEIGEKAQKPDEREIKRPV